MVLLESIATNETFVLIFGTLAILTAVLILIVFAFLFQRKLIRRQKAFRDIELMLQSNEVKAAYAILDAQELERERIAEDLHDRLGSRLAAVKLHFNAARVDSDDNHLFLKGIELLDGAVEEVREISHNLISGVLSKFGLVAALEDLKETLESTKQISLDLHIHNIDDRRNLTTESNIYRIVQELIANVLKHSRATEVVIQLTRHESNMILLVEDNGIGFDSTSPKQTPGIGLKNIHSRVSKLDGNINIDSTTGKGTVIIIEIPLPHDKYSDSRRP